MPRLVEEGDIVLMDLRSFAPANVGCVYELRHLVAHVPLNRCLLVVDDATDEPFLKDTVEEAWQSLLPSSPNRGRSPDQMMLHRFRAGYPAMQELLRRLCEAAATCKAAGGPLPTEMAWTLPSFRDP